MPTLWKAKYFLFFINILLFVLCVKSNIFANKLNQNKESITFIASSEAMGNGIDPSTMDYFQGVQYPQLSLLISHLQATHQKVEVVDWQDKNIVWSTKDRIILGPIWGYTKKIDEFISWLNMMEKKNVPIINNPKFLKWNLKKYYLLDLQNNKINIPNTIIIDSTSTLSFEESIKLFFEKFGPSDIIIKGVIDAGGFGYMHLHSHNLKDGKIHFNALKSTNSGVIIQSFIPQIYKTGELSFVFLDGKLSHYFVKVPTYDEERVQAFYGGRSFHFNKVNVAKQIEHIKSSFREDLDLTESDIKNAYLQSEVIYAKLLMLLDKLQIPHPKYLRMDGVMVDSNFVIMELEGIEPYLEMKEALANDPSNKSMLLWENMVKAL